MSDEFRNKQNPPDGHPRETFEGNRFEDDRMQRVHGQLLREKEEPTENFSPMPLLFVGLFMALSFWAGIYLIRTSGDFNPFHYDETKEGGALVADAGPVEIDMMAMGRGIYTRNCQVCHQADGAGVPGVYPPVVGSNWVQDNPERLIKVVLSGLVGTIEVNGTTYNNAMTAFGGVLSDVQIAAVLTYVRTGDSFENSSHPVTPELVADVRAEYGARRESWTGPELEAIHGPVTGEWTPDAAAEPAPATEEEPDSADEDSAGEEEAERELTPAQSALGGEA